ncbi:MAG TPA: two-component regulator propeller domain-containing protein [Bacteroidales bacterium]|nr:two-component regulator propeller domain-containing protein [Bacteroidales bacterium]
MMPMVILQVKRLPLLIIAAVSGIAGSAQTYFFDNYSTQQEFESKVYCIVQDRQHYVWLGTPAGLWRYEGKTFTNESQAKGLPDGSVRALFIDDNQNLWIGYEGGGIFRKTGTRYERIASLDSVLKSNITSINEDKDKRLWITSESDGALVIENPGAPVKTLKYEHFLKGKSLGDQVFNSTVTSNGNLYFITNIGIKKYNKEGHRFEVFKPTGLSTYFSISVFYEDSKGNLWFGTYNGGLSKMDARDKSFTYYDTGDGLASNWITAITEDKSGNIWIGHWKDNVNTGGISRIDPKGNIQVFNTGNGLHDDHIWCITEDHEGNLLIGTTDMGLEIFKGEKFVSYMNTPGVIGNQVNAIIESTPGDIWFGTNQGISEFHREKDRATVTQINQSNHFISNQIRFFKKDNNGNIWIGTGDEGVLLYNTRKRQFISQPGINSYIPYYQVLTKGITALEITNDGHLWIGTIEGLVEFDINNNRYVATYTQGNGIAGNEISALYADTKGLLWVGSGKNKGLALLKDRKFTIIKRLGEISPSCITEDRSGNIWIGTDSKGIYVLKESTVIHYGIVNGLLSNHINLLCCDEHDNIFAGSNLGLNKIDQRNQKIISYTRKLGFTGIETKPNAWFADDRGYMWIGTANGAMRCDSRLLAEEDTIKPGIRITGILMKGASLDSSSTRRFSSTENDFTFNYASISFANPEGITYQVLLQGYDEKWQDVKNETRKIYNKLAPGRYIFKVRAKNEYGEWTLKPAEYSFRILAPFYKRGYFIISVVLIILAFIIVYIKIRERNLIQEKRVLEARVNERTQALQEANLLLSMKNKDILDSITYAKRIQLAILPTEILFEKTFILYKPKDIVSGDFYWMNVAGGKEFAAAVDCTGHGVPGAFMSFIGFTSLNKIIIEQGIYNPAAILDRLNIEVAVTLHQKGEAIVNDGMDISLICYSPDTGILEFSGAFNSLVIIRNKELIEIKADRFAIGRSTGNEKNFTNHTFKVEKGDSVYMFSDGYADQFGGPDGKKFKTSTLKELLRNISESDTETRLKILDSAFENWKGNGEQIDDVLVFGRQF